MDWQLVLSIIIPLGAFTGWVYGRLDKKFEVVTKEIEDVRNEIKDVKTALACLDSRLSKIEGKLEEREFQEWKQRKVG